MPRQIASSGRSRSVAAASSASSYSSATRSTSGPSCGWRACAVGRRVEVGAAAEQQAVEAVEQRVRVVGEPVRGQHDRDPARLLIACTYVSRRFSRAGREVALAAAGRGAQAGSRLRPELVRDDADQWGAWRSG